MNYKKAVATLAVVSAVASCNKPKINSPLEADGTLGQPFNYQITATNSPTGFDAAVPPPQGVTVDKATGKIAGTPQATGTFPTRITATNKHGSDQRTLTLKVDSVLDRKELLILDPRVVASQRAKQGGPWHIRTLMQRLAGPNANVDAFAERWFNQCADLDNVNNDPFPKRA